MSFTFPTTRTNCASRRPRCAGWTKSLARRKKAISSIYKQFAASRVALAELERLGNLRVSLRIHPGRAWRPRPDDEVVILAQSLATAMTVPFVPDTVLRFDRKPEIQFVELVIAERALELVRYKRAWSMN
jgi:hypothetical protein